MTSGFWTFPNGFLWQVNMMVSNLQFTNNQPGICIQMITGWISNRERGWGLKEKQPCLRHGSITSTVKKEEKKETHLKETLGGSCLSFSPLKRLYISIKTRKRVLPVYILASWPCSIYGRVASSCSLGKQNVCYCVAI